MGQPELMTPAEFVKMYEKPPQVTLDGGQHANLFCYKTKILVVYIQHCRVYEFYKYEGLKL